MNIRFLPWIAAGFVICSVAAAQSLTPAQFNLKESLIESVASQFGESSDYENLLYDLENLQKRPIDLNRAGEEELRKLPFLTGFQIQSLLEYRKENGDLLSLQELALVYGFPDDLITMILPYVQVKGEADTANFRFRDAISASHHEAIFRTQRIIEKSAGYRDTDPLTGVKRYPGNPWLFYTRYGMTCHDHLRAGFTLEKDPGEEFFRYSNRNGFDFNSGYVMVLNRGSLESALLGDYRLGFGQGLTLSHGTSPGKSALSLNVIRRNDEIKAFTSTDENDFFRGAAACFAFGKVSITGFYSSKRRDANITDTSASGKISFSSFQESGHHRTKAEIFDEKAVQEIAWGGNIAFRGSNFKAGTTLVRYKLDKSMEAGNDLKDIYDFHGDNLLNLGADYSFAIRRMQFFGETAYGNHSWATLNGAVLSVNKYASFSLVYRNYSKGYFSLHGDAFSEGYSNVNEEGFYLGTVIYPVRKLKISAYADFYRFPWLRYGVSAPSAGSDYLLQADYSITKGIAMYCRIKYGLDDEDAQHDTLVIPGNITMQRSGIRYHISFRLTESLWLQNRVEAVHVAAEGRVSHWGFLIYQDVEYCFVSIPLTVDFRFAWFNTDDYSTRIYAYEQDLTSGFTFSPLYHEGLRAYLMLRYTINPYVNFRFRLAQTHFIHKTTIGSGYDEIESNTRHEIKLQLTVRF